MLMMSASGNWPADRRIRQAHHGQPGQLQGQVVLVRSGNGLQPDREAVGLQAGRDGNRWRQCAGQGDVEAFIESLGLRPLDVGGLKMAHWLEGMGVVTVALAGNGVGNFALGVNEFTG